MGPRAGLDGCRKSRLHRSFFSELLLLFSVFTFCVLFFLFRDCPGLFLHLVLYNTKYNTSMSPAGFEPEIPASERSQAHALDCAATGIGSRLRKVSPTGIRSRTFRPVDSRYTD